MVALDNASGDIAPVVMTERLLRLPDDMLSTYRLTAPVHRILALQTAFVAGCCQQAQEVGAAACAVKFPYSWQKRLVAFRSLPDGTDPAVEADSATPPELCVGVVGCGSVGAAAVRALLDAGFPAASIVVSTRSPAKQAKLAARGVRVTFDNEAVAARAHLLVLAVLPAQLAEAARAVRPHLAPRTVVLSLVGATPLPKLRQLLGTDAVLRARVDMAAARAALADAEAATAAAAAAGRGADTAAADGALPPAAVLDLAAASLAPDAAACRELLDVLPAALTGLELGEDEGRALAAECLFGRIADDEARAALVGALDAGADDEAAANVPALLKRRIEAALEPLVVVPFR